MDQGFDQDMEEAGWIMGNRATAPDLKWCLSFEADTEDEYEDDVLEFEIWATTPANAAKELASRADSLNGYMIAAGDPVVIVVRDPRKDIKKRVSVSGKIRTTYTAKTLPKAPDVKITKFERVQFENNAPNKGGLPKGWNK